MRDYRRFDVYQSAEQLVIDTCCCTATLPLEERYRLRAQMRAAAISIASNVSSRWHWARPESSNVRSLSQKDSG